MPTWAPSTEPGTFWLAFSSLRAYASVRPQGECGDGLDNDCDGTADEDDCQTCEAIEICGDSMDLGGVRRPG